MSYKHPSVNQIIACTTGEIGKHFGNSYLELAKKEFRKIHKKNPTLDDAQELRDIYENQWRDYYIGRPERDVKERIKAKPIWDFCVARSMDCEKAMIYFLRDIIKIKCWEVVEYGQYGQCYGTYIIDNNLLENFKEYAEENKKKIPYYKPNYEDYSHLAYNGVTDDF